MPADLAQVAWSPLNVAKTRSLAIWILDEIGEAIGTGNRVGDACGDNAQLGASGAGKSVRRVAKHARPHFREVGRQAIAWLFFSI
jgi:hypothetical protein